MPHHPPSNLAWPVRIPDARTIPLRDFNKHRQDFLRTFNDWLQTSADPTAALLELESTVNATRGLVALAFGELSNHPVVNRRLKTSRNAEMFIGHLRLDRRASPPWSYRGEITLPSGRTAALEAAVQEDGAGRFFALRGALQPGMTAAELEAALTEIETNRAAAARAEIDADTSDELPF